MSTNNDIPNMPGYLTSMQLGQRYNVSIETVRGWAKWHGYPVDSRMRHGQFMLHEVAKIDAWLRTRTVSNKGSMPRWLSIVNHKAAASTRSS